MNSSANLENPFEFIFTLFPNENIIRNVNVICRDKIISGNMNIMSRD
jgi:hypothetical protein